MTEAKAQPDARPLSCPRCAYDLRGTSGEACPECGLADAAANATAVRVRYRWWIQACAMALVVLTFILVTIGGTVTSKGAGLSVPDWPTTFGHNMFAVPLEKWIGVGGVFWEHFHRLMGSLVGFVTIGVCGLLWFTQRHRNWLRWLGVGLLVLVIVQGVMGGLRVTEYTDRPWLATTLAVLHGVTGQLFLCLTVIAAAALGRFWVWQNHEAKPRRAGAYTRWFALLFVATLVVQLILGAAMRHTGAGKAIPDFPTSYGRWVPPMTVEGIERAIDSHTADDFSLFVDYFTPWQVGIHYAHRVWAMVVTVGLFAVIATIGRDRLTDGHVTRPLFLVALLLLGQIALGVSVVFMLHHELRPDMATAHQAMGALLLATSVWLACRLWLLRTPPVNESPRATTQNKQLPLEVSPA